MISYTSLKSEDDTYIFRRDVPVERLYKASVANIARIGIRTIGDIRNHKS